MIFSTFTNGNSYTKSTFFSVGIWVYWLDHLQTHEPSTTSNTFNRITCTLHLQLHLYPHERFPHNKQSRATTGTNTKKTRVLWARTRKSRRRTQNVHSIVLYWTNATTLINHMDASTAATLKPKRPKQGDARHSHCCGCCRR